jgi:cytoskeletal protein RodZ
VKSSLLTLCQGPVLLGLFVVFLHAGCSEPKPDTATAAEPATSNKAPKAQAPEAAKTAIAKEAVPATAKPAEVAAGQPTPAAPAAAKPAASAAGPAKAVPGADERPIVKVQTLPEAKLKIDEMAQEMTKLITALRVAGKDKAKVQKLNADFETKNKRLTKEIEGIQQKLSPENLAQFEGYAKQKIAPLAQLLIQAYFQASGMNAQFEGR